MVDIGKIKDYLEENFDVSVLLSEWDRGNWLPLFLRKQYTFFEGCLYEKNWLFACDTGNEELTPTQISKHITALIKKYGYNVIYVNSSLTPYNRKRLVGHKVSFIIPGNQMYLPFLGIDFREHFINKEKAVKLLSPAAQAILFLCLLRGGRGDKQFTSSYFSDITGYSAMTISRAVKELIGCNLFVKAGVTGKFRIFEFAGDDLKKLFWDSVELFRNPVIKKVNVCVDGKIGHDAGITALSHLSMLSEPTIPTVALSKKEYTRLIKAKTIRVTESPEESDYEVEIWDYDPGAIITSNIVDQLSLYLTLKDDHDERTQIALDGMMEHIKW